MNLLLINQHYPPDAGATGKVLAELAEELAHRGHAVTALTGRPSYREARGTEAPARERRHGVTVERVRVLPRRDGALGRMAHYLSFAVAATWRGVRLQRPDAILAFSSTPFFGGLAVRVLAALKRVPYVYVVQDAWPEIAVALGALRPGWRERVARLFEGWTWRGAERVIVIGEELATLAAVRGVAADRVSVIENWADASRIVPQHISRFRRDLGFSDDDFVVEYAGNLGHAQALDTVLEAARVVRETSRAIRFLFVGEGARAATFRRRAELVPGVVCAPFQPEDRLSDVLAAADLGVVPLKSGLARYCVPSKVYSILASGRPVAAAVDADSEVARLIERAECGFRVDPDDPKSLAAEILRLAGDRPEAKALGRRGRVFCEREASLAKAADRYEFLLAGVIGRQDSDRNDRSRD